MLDALLVDFTLLPPVAWQGGEASLLFSRSLCCSCIFSSLLSPPFHPALESFFSAATFLFHTPYSTTFTLGPSTLFSPRSYSPRGAFLSITICLDGVYENPTPSLFWYVTFSPPSLLSTFAPSFLLASSLLHTHTTILFVHLSYIHRRFNHFSRTHVQACFFCSRLLVHHLSHTNSRSLHLLCSISFTHNSTFRPRLSLSQTHTRTFTPSSALQLSLIRTHAHTYSLSAFTIYTPSLSRTHAHIRSPSSTLFFLVCPYRLSPTSLLFTRTRSLSFPTLFRTHTIPPTPSSVVGSVQSACPPYMEDSYAPVGRCAPPEFA